MNNWLLNWRLKELMNGLTRNCWRNWLENSHSLTTQLTISLPTDQLTNWLRAALGQSLYSLVQAEPSASGWMSGGGGGGSDLGWWWGVGGRTLGSGGRRSDLEGGSAMWPSRLPWKMAIGKCGNFLPHLSTLYIRSQIKHRRKDRNDSKKWNDNDDVTWI